MANMAQLVNVIAPIFTNDKGLFLQTIYYPLQLFANNVKGAALELLVNSPKYESKTFGPTPYLDTSASYDNGTLTLNVVNRHRDQPIDVEFEIQDKSIAGSVEVTEVNGPDIKAENDFGVTKVESSVSSAKAEGRKLQYRCPAHSYSLLKLKLV
jgi:alpha-N-arabinofuranosidase